jgi:polyhydroxyalkanoate synthesis regulator protein
MSSFARQQQQVRQMVERTFSPFLPTGIEEMSRQNMALFDRALSMWNPFHRPSEQEAATAEQPEPVIAAAPDESHAELERLRHEVESLRQQLAAAQAAAAAPPLPEATTAALVPEEAPKAPRRPIRNKTPVDG